VKSRLGLALIVSTIIVGFMLLELERRWSSALEIPSGGYHLTVSSGQSLRSVATHLHEQGVLSHPRLLLAYGRWSGLDKEIKQGEYLLPQYLDMLSLMKLLGEGKVIHYQLTLPEGITLHQALALLVLEEGLEHVLDGPRDARILALIAPRTNPEGLFFPDSYRFERGTTDWQIVQRSYQRMQSVLVQEWSAKAAGLPYDDDYEALVMASIIERETGLTEERAQIAGVFVRRLKKNMRLQTDPTVIYGLGEAFDGNLRRVDLKDESNPYNTYRHGGLPPSPIALPGREAIHAALNPAEGDSLYFVARGDGGHVFSATLAEHQKAVKKYQLRRRADYRSSPET
jgi:UPF0755 protein